MQKLNPHTLLAVLVLSLTLVSFLLPRDQLTQTRLQADRFPLSAKKQLVLSRVLLQSGWENEALAAFLRAEKLAAKFGFLDSSGKLTGDLVNTQTLVYQPQKIKAEINYLNEVLIGKPHYRDLFLRLAVLHCQLYQDELARDYWQKAFYLDPNNWEVQQVGKLIGIDK